MGKAKGGRAIADILWTKEWSQFFAICGRLDHLDMFYCDYMPY